MTLQRISKSKLDVDLLYQEMMKTEGLENDFLVVFSIISYGMKILQRAF